MTTLSLQQKMAVWHLQSTFPAHHTFPFCKTSLPNLRQPSSFRCNLSTSSEPEPKPVSTSVTSSVPSTITLANLVLGFDQVTIKVDDPNVPPREVLISDITCRIGNDSPLELFFVLAFPKLPEKEMLSDKIAVVVKKAALKAGAFGCTICEAGRKMVAVVDDEEKGREIGERMVDGFKKGGGLEALAILKKLDRVDARLVDIPR